MPGRRTGNADPAIIMTLKIQGEGEARLEELLVPLEVFLESPLKSPTTAMIAKTSAGTEIYHGQRQCQLSWVMWKGERTRTAIKT